MSFLKKISKQITLIFFLFIKMDHGKEIDLLNIDASDNKHYRQIFSFLEETNLFNGGILMGSDDNILVSLEKNQIKNYIKKISEKMGLEYEETDKIFTLKIIKDITLEIPMVFNSGFQEQYKNILKNLIIGNIKQILKNVECLYLNNNFLIISQNKLSTEQINITKNYIENEKQRQADFFLKEYAVHPCSIEWQENSLTDYQNKIDKKGEGSAEQEEIKNIDKNLFKHNNKTKIEKIENTKKNHLMKDLLENVKIDMGEYFFLNKQTNKLYLFAEKSTHEKIEKYLNDMNIYFNKIIEIRIYALEVKSTAEKSIGDRLLINTLVSALSLQSKNNSKNFISIINNCLKDSGFENIKTWFAVRLTSLNNRTVFLNSRNILEDHTSQNVVQRILQNQQYYEYRENVNKNRGGYSIKITPRIYDNRIFLDLHMNIDSLNSGAERNLINSSVINLQTVVEPGKVEIISGIRHKKINVEGKKNKIFEKLKTYIPILGKLANFRYYKEEEGEVIIFIDAEIKNLIE